MFYGFNNSKKRYGSGRGIPGFNNSKRSTIGRGNYDGDSKPNRTDCQPFNFKKQDEVDLYHGTSKKNAKKIFKEGLKPKLAEYGASNKRVYMTGNPSTARKWARAKTSKDKDIVIIHTKVDTKNIPYYDENLEYHKEDKYETGLDPYKEVIKNISLDTGIPAEKLKEYIGPK